jgi:hypothetical protein
MSANTVTVAASAVSATNTAASLAARCWWPKVAAFASERPSIRPFSAPFSALSYLYSHATAAETLLL